MTYRELLEAMRTASELQHDYVIAANNPKRWKGTAQEKDAAEAAVHAADRALDAEIPGLEISWL